MRHNTPNAKLCQIFTMKMGHFCYVFSQRKLGENSVLCAMIHQRWNAAEFPPQKLGEMLSDFHRENLEAILNVLAKHWVRPHPLQNQISKPNSFKAPKANANSLFQIANVRKFRFYQKKWLSPNRHYRVPNTFPARNQTSEFKNQDSLPIRFRLRKTTFFFSLGSIIKSNKVRWPITP